jgi:hypothetical protein
MEMMVDTLQNRVELNNAVNAELQQRITAHQATIARLRSAQALAPAAVQPLAMLAHGDSWFDYPLSGNSPIIDTSDIIHYLGLTGSPLPVILNVSHYGDATTDEMSWPKQQKMIDAIADKNNWLNSNGLPDAILFSGGGNDVVGDKFCIYVNYNTGGGVSGLNQARFDEALDAVEASYLDLFAFRDRYAPNVPIFGHCYDFALPSGVHPICAGPWLKPSLDFAGWSYADGKTIVRDALTAFKNKLVPLQAGNNFHLIDTQGQFVDSDWANELHPYPNGFMKLAQQFAAALRTQFPGRI